MQDQINFYEDLERQLEDVRNRLQTTKQELSSYETTMALLKDHINENLSVQKRLALNKEDDRKMAIVKESYDKLQTKYERYRQAKVERDDDYKKQLTEKMHMEVHLNSMKAQINSLKKLQESQDDAINKQEPSYNYDVETINFLNECNWNFGDSCDRNLAENLLSCFPSGTFLVRSSKTKTDLYALSVVANSRVRHCLIDKIEDEYCFHPPGPQRQRYPTLCSLVMDYRHKTLKIHNPELDTNLVYPVLSQLKKNRQG